MSKPESTPKTEKTDRKTVTNWGVFTKLGAAIASLSCEGYAPIHRFNAGCHSKVQVETKSGPIIENLVRHMENHGGGFCLELELGKTPSQIWNSFEDTGIECINLRCDVCDKSIPIHPVHVRNHVQNHLSKNRRMEKGGKFWLTISPELPIPSEDEAFAA